MTARRALDPLAAGTSYPPITITVDVDPNAPENVVNTVYLTRDGEINLDNNISNDLTSLRIFQITDSTPDFSTGIVNAGTDQIKLHFNSKAIDAE